MLYGTFKPFRFYFVLLFSVPFVVQKLSSEIVQKTKVCANIFKECKGMEDEAVAYIDRWERGRGGGKMGPKTPEIEIAS